MRVHTAGSVGGSTAIVASHLVEAGVHERVLTVAFEKQSESDAMWALTVRSRRSSRRPSAARAATSRRTSARTCGARARRADTGMRTVVKDRLNALKNPYAHLHQADITLEPVAASPMLWDPIRYAETCPSSDGACAMVLASESAAAKRAAARRRGCTATAMRREPTMFAGRDQVNPRAGRDCAARRLQAGGHHEPAQGDRLRRDLRAVLVVRADVDGEPGLRAARARAGR